MNEAEKLKDGQNEEMQAVAPGSMMTGSTPTIPPAKDPAHPKVEIVHLQDEIQGEASATLEATAVAVPEVLVQAEHLEDSWEADDMDQASPAELLAQNRELLGWISQLERSLADCQSDFKAHLKQFRQQEDLLETRTAELLAKQSQMMNLSKDLDAAQKANQRQQIVVETMTAQLEASQERIAQMERECTLVQRRCADQAQQLLQAESLCRDLKSRLNRQQRHTLQFKAALEKSLEVSVGTSNIDLPDLEVEPIDHPDDFFPRSKPVKPWSQQLSDSDFADMVSMAPGDEETEILIDHVEPVFDPNMAKNLETSLKFETEAIFQGSFETAVEETAQATDPWQATQPAPCSRVAFVPPIVPQAPVPSPPGLVAAQGDGAEKNSDQKNSHGKDPEQDGSGKSDALAHSPAETSGDVSPDPSFDPATQANWPAPLVNPLRPAKKKIGSLAAIDLPSFPKAPA